MYQEKSQKGLVLSSLAGSIRLLQKENYITLVPGLAGPQPEHLFLIIISGSLQKA